VALNNAYEAIQEHMKTRHLRPAFRGAVTSAGAPVDPEAARRRAYEFAKKKYEEYLNSEQDQKDQDAEAAEALFDLVILVILLVVLPIFLVLKHRAFIAMWPVALFVTLPITIPMVRKLKKLRMERIRSGFYALAQYSLVGQFIFMLVNAGWLFYQAMFTMVRPWVVVISFVVLTLAGFLVPAMRGKSEGNRWFILAGCAGLFLNACLLVNSLFSTNTTTEIYRYEQFQTMIRLEKDTYREYPGIRFFIEKDSITGSYISYTIADGLLGFRVVEDREFRNTAPRP
jgi:hypothetical protein